MRDFFRSEPGPGIVLLLCTALALLWANSPASDIYHALHPLVHWINDGLMTVFFLLVGLEIKRELLGGELSRPRQAALPMAAALGGMLAPALVYAFFNHGGPGSAGWGIPMATDIAFALGVLSLLGSRVPAGLKVFLAALAILDDIGAVLVIALFYTAHLDLAALGAAGAVAFLLLALNRLGVRAVIPYLALGVFLWAALLRSGVHATLAGVVLAFFIPHRVAMKGPAADAKETPLERLEGALQPWVSYLVLPLFALANAGIAIGAGSWSGLLEPIGLGVAGGLIVGKPVGILLFTFLAVIVRLGEVPAGVTARHIAGCSLLGGIGFTMSIFIAGLGLGDAGGLDEAKLAILCGSFVSGVAGYLFLRAAGAPAASGPRPMRAAMPPAD